MSTHHQPKPTTPGADLPGHNPDSTDLEPRDIIDAEDLPLPTAFPEDRECEVHEREHDGPVSPSETPPSEFPFHGAHSSAPSDPWTCNAAGQLHRLMSLCRVYIAKKDGEDIDHPLLDEWVSESIHPLKLSLGARDHELSVLALGHVIAEHVDDGCERSSDALREPETSAGSSVVSDRTRDASGAEQGTLAEFAGGDGR